MTNTPKAEAAAQDHPIYWFVALEEAVERGDHQAAAEVYRQLARLGVRVAYGRPKAGKDGLAMKPSETAPLLRKAVGTVKKLFWSMGKTPYRRGF